MRLLTRIVVLVALVAVAAAGGCATTSQPTTTSSSSRAEATQIIANLRKVVTPAGVERLEAVRIGGIDQWISIRGHDRRNPVLLMIHGGPGFVSMPTSWYFQRGWEEYFTVVQWDQRGAGKTYVANDPAKLAPTMTRERIVEDALELIAWLRRELGKERIFVVGHSWGSVIGLDVAQRRPEWLHAYIGFGQATNVRESERRGWQFVMERARAEGNAEAIRELQALAPYAAPGQPLPLAALGVQRKWLGVFGGAVHGRTDGMAAEAAAITLAPEYTDADVAKVWEANAFSEQHLLPAVVDLDLSTVEELACPLILFSGRHDHNVSSAVGAEWFARVRAPVKHLVWFERSAHEVMIEEPGKTLLSLVQYARPLAEQAGDAPP